MDIRGGGREGFLLSCLENFCLTVSKNFLEEPFFVPKNFLVWKIVRDRSGGWISLLFIKSVGSLNTETSGRRTILCFRKSRVSNNFMPKR